VKTRPAWVWLAGLCVFLSAAEGGRAQIGPPRAEVTPIVERDGAEAGASARVALSVRLPEGLHANSNRPRDPLLIPMVVSVTPPTGVTVEEIVYPQPTDLKQAGIDLPLSVFERQFAVGISLKVDAGVAPGPVVVPVTLRYQACDETMCYLPATAETAWTLRVVALGETTRALHAELFAPIPFGTGDPPVETAAVARPADVPAEPVRTTDDPLLSLDRFTVLGMAAGYLGTDDFLRVIRNAEMGVVEKGWFEDRGPLAILLIVLVGGLALNLTPCVLPLIPVNLAIIGAGSQAGTRGRGFLLGAAYGAAMAVVYGVLGLIVILTASTFGTINASPWFNLGIAVLFVVLALAMFDVIVIDFSRMSSRFHVRESGRGTFLVAFGMGAVAALLAGACVAPVVIQVVLFSSSLYAAGTSAALALPFLLGLGMALPWPIAGAGLAALPRPGAWMIRVKQVFGVFILGTALYYGYLAYGLFESRSVNAADVQASVEEKLKEGWYADLAAGLAVAEREQKPVLIDLWATWCKNCLVMDKTTLADPAVTSALERYVKIKFQAENPDEPPAAQLMRRFGAIGLPTYVILKPRSG
jgi:cytochrome c biogenesis protein CcdA